MSYIIFLSLLVVLVFASDLASLSVYGEIFRKEKLDAFFIKNFSKYDRLNSYESNMLMADWKSNFPYISTHFSLLSKWYIESYGQIPRWSKWSKELDKKHRELKKLIVKDSLDKYS